MPAFVSPTQLASVINAVPADWSARDTASTVVAALVAAEDAVEVVTVLGSDVSAGYVEAEVQAIVDKLDEVIVALQTMGILSAT